MKFAQINKFTYRIAVNRQVLRRKLLDYSSNLKFSVVKEENEFDYKIYTHSSLIRRKLGNVDMLLQDNKAVNLEIAADKINGVVINPGECFSIWRLVGPVTKRRGYLEGLMIKGSEIARGTGGGLCQLSNLIHWIVLHSPLEIVEHHHHNRFDLFPDYDRQIPFGTGTSIMYNYLDYRFQNNTDTAFQLFVKVDGEYLKGQLRADKQLDFAYHILEKDKYFYRNDNKIYRHNMIYRKVIRKSDGFEIGRELIIENNALVMYDEKFITHQITAASSL